MKIIRSTILLLVLFTFSSFTSGRLMKFKAPAHIYYYVENSTGSHRTVASLRIFTPPNTTYVTTSSIPPSGPLGAVSGDVFYANAYPNVAARIYFDAPRTAGSDIVTVYDLSGTLLGSYVITNTGPVNQIVSLSSLNYDDGVYVYINPY